MQRPCAARAARHTKGVAEDGPGSTPFPGAREQLVVGPRREDVDYLHRLDHREEGGTPAIAGDIRAGLAFLVKSVKFGLIGPVVFYFGHILSDFVWYTAVTILIWKGKRLLVGRGLKALILVCALFLVYLGVSFILDGVRGTL